MSVLTLADVFSFGASNYRENQTDVLVDVSMTTNHCTPPVINPWVSFAQWAFNGPRGSGGSLFYRPRMGRGPLSTPPYFESFIPARAYFSDRRNDDNSPFNPEQTDDLSLAIKEVDPTIAVIGAPISSPYYVASFSSQAYGNTSWRVLLQTDAATGVSFGSLGGIFHVFGFTNLTTRPYSPPPR